MCLFLILDKTVVTALGMRMVQNASGAVPPFKELTIFLTILENNHMSFKGVLGSMNLSELWQPANFSGSFKWSFDQ